MYDGFAAGCSATLSWSDINGGRPRRGSLDDSAGGVPHDDVGFDQGSQVPIPAEGFDDLKVDAARCGSTAVGVDGGENSRVASIAVGMDADRRQVATIHGLKNRGHHPPLVRRRSTTSVLEDQHPTGWFTLFAAVFLEKKPKVIQSRRTNPVYTLLVLAHADDAFACALGRGQVKVGELGDGMSKAVVEITGCNVAAVNVSEQAPRRDGCERAGHRLDPVAQYDNDVGAALIEKSSDPRDTSRESLSLIQRPIISTLHGYTRVDIPAVIGDVVDCVAELLEQVHAGSDKLELKTLAPPNGFYGRAQ